MMVCSECGASVAADARFCASCGTPLGELAGTGRTEIVEPAHSADTLPSAPVIGDDTSAPDDARRRRSRAKALVPVFVGLLLVGGIVAVAILAASSGSDNSRAALPRTPATTVHPAVSTDPSIGQAIAAADAVDFAAQVAGEELQSVNAKYPGTKDGPYYDTLGKIYDYVAADLQTSANDRRPISYPPAAIAEANAALAAVRTYAAACHDLAAHTTGNTAPRPYIDQFKQTQLEAHSAIDALRTKLHSLAGSQPR